MTDYILGLVPYYGLPVLFFVVVIACLAVPLPSSILVLVCGGLAAAGDLTLWQVLAVAFAGFVVGDQIAYQIARKIGPPLLDGLRSRPRFAPLITRGQTLLDTNGTSAVLLSHTVLSPTCPYVSYICGAGGLRWRVYTVAAVIGAAIWACVYGLLGYVFAEQLAQVTSLIGDFLGVVTAAVLVAAFAFWLRRAWRNHRD